MKRTRRVRRSFIVLCTLVLTLGFVAMALFLGIGDAKSEDTPKTNQEQQKNPDSAKTEEAKDPEPTEPPAPHAVSTASIGVPRLYSDGEILTLTPKSVRVSPREKRSSRLFRE